MDATYKPVRRITAAIQKTRNNIRPASPNTEKFEDRDFGLKSTESAKYLVPPSARYVRREKYKEAPEFYLCYLTL